MIYLMIFIARKIAALCIPSGLYRSVSLPLPPPPDNELELHNFEEQSTVQAMAPPPTEEHAIEQHNPFDANEACNPALDENGIYATIKKNKKVTYLA